MKYSLQAKNSLCLTHPTLPSYRFGIFNVSFLFLLALSFLVPANMTAAPFDGAITTATTTNKKLVIKNNGNCTVRVYHWLATGDIFKKELKAGSSWSVYTDRGQMWRVINTNPDWKNLKYDEHYTVGRDSWQKWTINPTYCTSATSNCNAELEHFSAVGETGCNKNDGKIITDPYIDRGLKLPYYVEYSYNGNTKKHGPYHYNQDNYIKGLAPGTYKNLTVIDGNNCRKNHGDVTVEKAHCQTTQPTCNAELEHFSAVAETGCDKNDGKIITDPYIDRGLKLPYYVEYSFNGSTKKHGPYHENKDNYITGLASGVYKNLTVIDGNDCRKNHGDVTVKKATCPVVQPPVVQPPVELTCNLKVDAGGDQKICAGNSVDLVAAVSGASSCTVTTGTGTLSGSKVIANWDMNNCKSFSGDNSNFDFSELKAVKNSLSCAGVSTKGLYVTGNNAKHSCTDDASTGEAGDAVCVGMPNIGSFQNDHPQAVRFDVTIDPSAGISGITKLQFSELAPKKYVWSAAGYHATTGYNNYPTKYGIRVLKNGQEIYKKIDVSTNQSWSVEKFDFSNEAAFITSSKAVYTFELLAYHLVGNGAKVSAWDLDDIKVYGACGTTTTTTNTATTYKWSNGSTDASIQVTEAGTYKVTTTDCNGCTATDEVVVTVDNSAITVSANGTIDCANTNVTLNASGATLATYKWSGPNGFSAGEAAPSVSAAGTYTLVATTTDGCEVEASVQVEGDDSVPSATVLSGGPFEFCVGDGEADNITAGAITLLGNEGSISQWVVTDGEGITILGLPEMPSAVDFDGAGEGTCLIWNLSHDGSLRGAAAGALVADLTGCYSLSNSIIVNRVECEAPVIPEPTCEVVGGNLSGGPFEFCVGDGAADNITAGAITLSVNEGSISQWVVTDGEGITILGLPEMPSAVDFDGAGEGTCLIWNLSHDGSLGGAAAGALVADLTGCYSLSNSIIVNRVECEEPVLPAVTINDITVNEEDGVAELMICIDQATNELVTVRYVSSNESAVDGEDYQAQDGVAVIEAGELCAKVSFPILDDELEEATEKFVVTLSAPSNATISDDEGMVTILDTDEPAVIPALTINDIVVNEEDGLAELMICIEAAAEELVTVRYVSSNESAIEGEDYQAQDGVAVIEAGELCAKVSFPILDDEVEEATEKFVVTLSAPSNATISDDEGMVTILDVDEPVKATLSINDVIVNEEDGIATLEICLDNIATEFVYVRYATADDSAKQGMDYRKQSNYAFIPEGEQCAEVIFNILDDNKEEADEVFKVVLSSPFNAELLDAEGIVTILDTDIPSCDTKGGSITGGPFEFCVGDGKADNIATGVIRVSGNAGAYTQWVVTDALATTILGLPNSPSDVDFDGAGTGACLIWYLSHDGSLTGAAEGAAITDLQGCFSLSNSIAVNRVACNDPTLNISDVIVNEEDGIAILEICLDQPTTEFVYVRYTTSDDSANRNRDYKGQSSYAFIAEGEQCATVEFDIINDEIEESDETFVVTLSTPYNAVIADGEGTVTILDADAPVVVIPDPKVAIDDVVVFEDEQIAILTICSDATSSSPITVSFSTLNETADAGSDYQETAGIATIPAGMNCTEIELSIIDDKEDERDEVFVVELSAPTNAIIADAFGTVSILDNDEAIVIQPIELPLLTITDVTVNENEGFAHLQICLDQPAIQAVTVDCITADGTAIAGVDYLQTEDVAIIPVGQTCTQASFKILDDFNAEDTELYYVNLSNATNAIIADDQGIITILDNDEIERVECPEMDVYTEDGNIIVSGLAAPIEIVQIFNASFEIVFQCMNDCEPTEVIENLPVGEYTVRINCYNNTWGLLCTEETKVIVLDENTPPAPLTCAGNITNGGRIAGEESFCGTYNPTLITSEISAAGGAESRDIEYLWLASTVDCPSEIEDQIPGATGPTYDPGPITETTYFVRCSRRLGCTVWVESNCIVKDVFCPDGNLDSAADSRNRIATSNTTLSTTKQVDKTYTQTGTQLIEGTTQATNFNQTKVTDINFYPNPVRDVLTVDLSALAGQVGQAYLSNQMGQVVKTLDLGVIDASPIQIQTGMLANGLYHLTIVAEGQLVTTEKIMVQQY